MFWFSDDFLKKLSGYPCSFSDEQKNKIIAKMNLIIPDFSSRFTFKKANYIFLIDHEIEFIEAIIETSKNPTKAIENINNSLCFPCQLRYEEGKLFNVWGYTAKINIEKMGDSVIVRKTIGDSSKQKYFINEKEIYEQINSFDNQFFVKCYGFENSSIFLEMATDTLDTFIKKNKTLTNNEKIQIIIDLCKDLEFFHNLGYLHRDLHPNNFFVFQKDSQRFIKLGDFGLSIKMSDLESEQSSPRDYYGAIDYISPEQAQSISNCSIQSEIYSIGKIINYVMTNSPKKNYHQLSSISSKCTLNNPSCRYASVSQLLQAINSVTNGI